TYVTGDIGTNVGLTTGFDPLLVTGTIHPIPDASTAQCAADLLDVYNYLNTLPYDIELLYPAQFGNNLVLTPHTYLMNAAATFTDTLYLNAQGNANAVFVIQINGALSTSTYSKVILINGTQEQNVYWMVEGAVDINEYSVFRGTIICNNGAISLNNGVTLDGRSLTTTGALNTSAITATMPPGCNPTGIAPFDAANTNEAVTIYPNPFSTSTTIMINDASQIKEVELRMYNVLGKEVMNTTLTKQLTTLETSNLPSGIYFYKVISNNKIIQSGKLVSQK
ncbi:MAG: ice-binding family protein, partial [Bacteroidales bacterium]|nr:ice-binding family protein [Bacteroidales bacterium]